MEQKLNIFSVHRDGKAKGFTLIELLAVIAIIILLSALTIPAFKSLTGSSGLNRASQTVNDLIALARQEAVSKNKEVQVIFLKLAESDGQERWRGIQLWRINETLNGPVPEPVSRTTLLSAPMVITDEATLSPLLGLDPYTPGTDPEGNPTADDSLNELLEKSTERLGGDLRGWARLRFRSNGATDSRITSGNSFITVQNSRDSGTPPANYSTIQINPVTGKLTIYRP